MTLTTLDTASLLDQALTVARRAPDPDAEDRWALIHELRRRPTAAVFEAASEWCYGAHAADRALGADVLAQLGTPSPEGIRPFAAAATPTLLDLLSDPDPTVLVCAVFALGHLQAGDASSFSALAQHPRHEVRHAVAFALSGRDEPEAVTLLVQLSRDENPKVRDWATFGLGTLTEHDGDEIRSTLHERLADDDVDVRAEAMLGLALRGDSRAHAAIAAALHDRVVGPLVIEAAAALPSPAFVAPLALLLAKSPGDEDIAEALRRSQAL